MLDKLLRMIRKTKHEESAKKEKRVYCIDGVKEVEYLFKEDHQGKTVTHSFYCGDESIGTIQTEHWKEQNILLVHQIRSRETRTGQGEAMIGYLLKQYPSETIIAVHAFGGTGGFWVALNKTFGERVRALDMRLEEYQTGLNIRREALE